MGTLVQASSVERSRWKLDGSRAERRGGARGAEAAGNARRRRRAARALALLGLRAGGMSSVELSFFSGPQSLGWVSLGGVLSESLAWLCLLARFSWAGDEIPGSVKGRRKSAKPSPLASSAYHWTVHLIGTLEALSLAKTRQLHWRDLFGAGGACYAPTPGSWWASLPQKTLSGGAKLVVGGWVFICHRERENTFRKGKPKLI